MKGIKINVSNNIAQITEKPQRIIAGTVGLPVEYTFDSHWDGLVKYAVFAAGKKLMMFEIENTAVIPWEVLRKPGQQLMIGVYGENPDGTEALPTVWANAGVIRHGAIPGIAPGIPSPPPVWESIKNSIGELEDLNTENKETIVAAINEVADMAADKEVYIAEYGKASLDEINEARNSGKAVFCYMRDYGTTLPLVLIDRVTATFSCVMADRVRVVVNSSDVWSFDDFQKVSEIHGPTAADFIPSVGAVRTYVAEQIETKTPLVVNRDISDSAQLLFNKTYAEIDEADNAGQTVLLNDYYHIYFMKQSGPDTYRFYPIVTANDPEYSKGYQVRPSGWSEIDTGFKHMTESKVKDLIEENASGGGLVVTVTATQSGPNTYTYSKDTDYDTIKAAVNEGKEVIIRCERYYNKVRGYQYYMYWNQPDPPSLGFISLATLDGTYEEIILRSDGSIFFTTYDMPVLKTTAQELTDSEKEQVKTNLGIEVMTEDKVNELIDEKLAGGSGGSSNATLTFTGAVNATYDGSKEVSVEIPQGGGGGEWKKVTTIQFATDVLSYELDISAYSELFVLTTSASTYTAGTLAFGDATIRNFNLFKNVNLGIHVIINKNKWVCATCQRGDDVLAQLHTLPCSNTDTMTFAVGSMTTPGAIDVYGR